MKAKRYYICPQIDVIDLKAMNYCGEVIEQQSDTNDFAKENDYIDEEEDMSGFQDLWEDDEDE